MPATRPDQKRGHLVVEPVLLAVRAREPQAPFDRVRQVRLAFDQVGPGRRIGIFEVGHENPSARVQGVDQHLGVGWSGDLDAAIAKIVRNRGDLPVRLAHGLCLRQEIWGLPRLVTGLALVAHAEKLEPAAAKLPLQAGEKFERRWRQNAGCALTGRTLQLHMLGGGHGANVQERFRGSLGAAQPFSDGSE